MDDQTGEYILPIECPTVGVGAKTHIINTKGEATKVTDRIRHWYEARTLRYYFYFPAFCLTCVTLTCLVLFLIVFIINAIIKGSKAKKRNKRIKLLDPGNKGDGLKDDIDDNEL